MTVVDLRFNSDEKSTWCPGCGDFGILAALKQALPRWTCTRTRSAS